MRKIAEIRRDIDAKVSEIRGIDKSNVEALEKATEELRALTAELNAANAEEEAAQATAERKFADLQKSEGRHFSLAKFLRELSEGKLTGIEAEAAQMGRDEYLRMGLQPKGTVLPLAALRSAVGQNVTTPADGGNLKETAANRYVEVLKEKLVLAQLGMTVLTDLVGEVPVITSGSIKAGWGAEAAQATAQKVAFSRAVMSPKRNYVQAAFTKDLLAQTSADVEAMLRDRLVEAHAELIESAAISGTGTNSQPTGLLNAEGVAAIALGTNGGNIDWKNVVAMEGKVNSQNAGRGKLGYVTNSKVMTELKSTQKANGLGFLCENGRMNGFPCEWSNLVPSDLTKGTATGICSAMIFGNFRDLYAGSWGGLDLVVDPYTHASTAEVIITINAFNDILVAEPKSFVKIVDIKTTL